jgi:hypothetical protein
VELRNVKRRLASLVLVGLFALPGHALARATEHNLPVRDAVESGDGKENLLDVPFYMAGQPHPGVARVIGEWSSDRRTRAAFRSDEAACKVAFLSALISLQERARAEGGDAIIDIVSVARDRTTKSASEYRCYAGAAVAQVALEGKVVKLAK